MSAAAVGRNEADKSEQAAAGSVDQRAASDIIVQAKRQEAYAGTKTETPLIQVPQPLTVITSDTYLAQGAINRRKGDGGRARDRRGIRIC